MELSLVSVEKPAEMNFILGQAHFIKTIEDLYEAVVQTCSSMKFGVAFCEASGPALIRLEGNDDRLIGIARANAEKLAAGHAFIIFMENGFPVNILNAVKQVPEVCRVFCATANPTQVIIASSEQGRGIVGVIDGVAPRGVESPDDARARKKFLRTIGYKL